MKRTLTLFSALAVAMAVAACTAPRPQEHQLSQKSVDYRCGPGGQDILTVQYTFQGEEALAAKVIYQNQVVDLPRVTLSNADMLGNTFRGNGFTWTTQQFDYDTVASARGNMLTRDAYPAHSDVAAGVQPTTVAPAAGQPSDVSNIIVRDCAVAAVS